MVVDGTVADPCREACHVHHPHRHGLVADPVGSGLVTSLAHPGGNVTGLSMMIPELSAKQLQLLKEAIPRLTRVTVLWNPDYAVSPEGDRGAQGSGALAVDRA